MKKSSFSKGRVDFCLTLLEVPYPVSTEFAMPFIAGPSEKIHSVVLMCLLKTFPSPPTRHPSQKRSRYRLPAVAGPFAERVGGVHGE